MPRALHRPTLRQAIVLAVIGASALGYGVYMRYAVIENASMGIACGGGKAQERERDHADEHCDERGEAKQRVGLGCHR